MKETGSYALAFQTGKPHKFMPTYCPFVEKLYEAGNILKQTAKNGSFVKRSWELIDN